MNGLEGIVSAAYEVQRLCARLHWKFCFIGGVAVQRWGNPRFTQDVDLTVLTGFGEEEQFIDALLKELSGRQPDAREFALRHRVLLARTASGVDVDVALGAFPFEERSIARASSWKPREGAEITTCSAEDLVVHKVFAGRDRDWADVEGIITRQHRKLDLSLVRTELPPLLELKEDSGALQKFESIVTRVDARFGT